jgi:hypothetical protein
VRRVLFLIALLAMVANAKYIKVADYSSLNSAVKSFAKLSKNCNSYTYLFKTKGKYEIRVSEMSKLSKLKKKFSNAVVINKKLRDKNFIEVATLIKAESVKDIFKNLRKVDNAYVKSNGRFYEFRVDIPSKTKLDKDFDIVKSFYKDAWVRYPYDKTQSKEYVVNRNKAVHTHTANSSEDKYTPNPTPAKEIRRDYSKIVRNTPKVIKIDEPIAPKKNINVNEPIIPTGVITIAQETDEYLNTRVEIKKGDRVLMSGRVLDDYSSEDIYCQK